MKLTISASLLLMLAGFGAAACSSDNSPSTNGNGGSSAASGGASTASGGATTASGGASTASGGASSTSGGASTASGGASTTSGGATTGGGDYQPSCTGLTAGGVEIAKNGACSATDPQKCYKTCGPQSVGFKSETCTAGVYAEGACEFPADKDYSCFKIPATGVDHTTCGTTTPIQNGSFAVFS